MDNLDFSEDEIQEQLALLGYRNIPKHRLRQFKRDLDELIRCEEWKSLASPSTPQPPRSQSGPPAFTKEKVDLCATGSPDSGFFLHTGEPVCRQARTSCQKYGSSWEYRDSYARHSVAPKLPTCLLSARTRDPEDSDDSEDSPPPPPSDHHTPSDRHTPSPDRGAHGRHFIKRKVLRKHKGQSLIFDESVYSEDLDAASGLDERLAELHVSATTQHDSETESDDVTSPSDGQSSDSDGLSLTAFESYIRGMARMKSDFRPRSKSFIRPVVAKQRLKKCDPVDRYFQYKQVWKMFKLPGETDMKAIRKEIQEQLAYQPPPPKPRRVYVPNTYVVPTEKKRSALRWEIRNDLANGLMPGRPGSRF